MRLIDADELITAFPCGETVRTECVRATIEHMSTIEERKTGAWCVTPDGMIVCSNCFEIPTNRIIINEELVYDMTPIKKRMRYCPNCGAKMEGEGDETD